MFEGTARRVKVHILENREGRHGLRRLLSLCLALLLMLPLFLVSFPTVALAAENCNVRVLLTTDGSGTQTVQVNGTYTLAERPELTLTSGTYYTITNTGGSLTISGGSLGTVTVGTKLTMRHVGTTGGSIGYLYMRDINRSYRGDITFSAYYSSVRCVNTVYMEDYVIGVIRGEMGEGFPLEALKAQAIAARTYAFMRLKTSGDYDIGDTSADQVYRGYKSADVNCIQAVEATRGMLVYYNNYVIDTYYGASNGGQTELIGNKWSDRASGNYSRMFDDPYDLRNPESPVDVMTISKTGSFSNYSLEALLRQKMNGYYGSIFGVDSIQLSNPRRTASGSENSRYYMNITFNLIVPSDGGTYSSYSDNSVTNYDPFVDYSTTGAGVLGSLSVASLLKSYTDGYSGSTKIVSVTLSTQSELINIISPTRKCSMFTVVDTGSAFRLEARRYGHGVGMSQRGAQQMANEGHTYQAIISFYYPGTNIVQRDFVRSDGSSNSDYIVGGSTTPPINNGATVIGTGIVTASTLNVRSQPSTTAGKLSPALAKNATVSITGESGDFYSIVHGTSVGYVAKQFINATITGSGNTNTNTNENTNTNTGSTSSTYQGTISSKSGKAPLYAGASTFYTQLGTLSNGEVVSINGAYREWSSVTTQGGKSGYVLTEYIVSQSQPNPSTSGSSGIYTTTSSTTSSDPVVTTSTSSTGKGVISNSGGGLVNMRSGPGTNYSTVAQVGNGKEVDVLAKNGEWYKISVSNITGYVRGDLIKFSGTVSAETDISITTGTYYLVLETADSKMRLRAKPSTSDSSATLASLPHGTAVRATGETSGEWAKVTYEGKTGYIKQIYLSATKKNPTGTAAPSSSSTTSSSSSSKSVTTTANVYMREKADAKSSSVQLVPKGTAVTLVEKGSSYTKCTYNGKTGYISNQYLK